MQPEGSIPSEHPDVKVGFSKFAELRPKECVLAGATGTHSVCVCMCNSSECQADDGRWKTGGSDQWLVYSLHRLLGSNTV